MDSCEKSEKFMKKKCIKENILYNKMATHDTIKFQELTKNETYTVIGVKTIESKFGKSFILKVEQNSDNNIIHVWSSNKINEYIKKNKIPKTGMKFVFRVKQLEKGKYKDMLYADIDGEDNDDGFINLK